MLETVKTYIAELPDTPFEVFYQEYICDVQDQNIQMEINSIQTDEILSVNKLLDKLHKVIR